MFRSLLVTLGAASLALISACAAPAPTIGSGTGPGPPGSAPPAGLARFYDQQIAFGPCAPYATTELDGKLFADPRYECARVEVPLDYTDPDGARGRIALLRLPARGERIGSLLVNPGGPGSSGMSFVAMQANEVLGQPMTKGRVGDRFDVIGFDPRGVGASTPRADCYTDAEHDRGEGFHREPVPDITDEQQAREVAQRCTEGSGGPEALVGLGTSDVVRDTDVLRAVLGDERLSYLGYSYGTELGAMYAEAFPQNVRAVVLDGAIDPDLTAAEFRASQYIAFQESFTAMATACASSADCPLGTDPARATEAFQAIVRPLLDEPAPTADGRGLTYDDALSAVMAGLYSEASWSTITQGLTEVAAGRGDVLLGLRDGFFMRDEAGRYGLDLDTNTAIRCMDNPRRTPAEQTELARQAYAAAPFLDPGRPGTQLHHECEAWPEPPSRPEPWLTGDVAVPPTLTVSVTGDPATPHQGGITMARLLEGSLLTVEGAQHGIALFGQSECVDGIVTDYLIDLRTPPDAARCTL